MMSKMKKKSLITTLIAAPILSLSSMAFAAQPAEPVALTSAQMDSVTAGAYDDYAAIGQINISPVTIVQINALNYGYAKNYAEVYSGNWADTYQ